MSKLKQFIALLLLPVFGACSGIEVSQDYDEYAVVLQGTFTGTVGGKPIVLGPGDECFIPAGVPHGGSYSANYRAIDAFGGQRVKRLGNSDDELQQR